MAVLRIANKLCKVLKCWQRKPPRHVRLQRPSHMTSCSCCRLPLNMPIMWNITAVMRREGVVRGRSQRVPVSLHGAGASHVAACFLT
jgi:hypothetical protein